MFGFLSIVSLSSLKWVSYITRSGESAQQKEERKKNPDMALNAEQSILGTQIVSTIVLSMVKRY